MEWKIPVTDLDFDEQEVQAVSRVVRLRRLTMGPETEAFEQEAAEFLGCDHAVLTSSGSAAIHLALRALDIGVSDEVLLPSLAHVLVANAVLYCGATPVFVDILHPENPTIDVEDAGAKISHHSRSVIPLHFAGFPCQVSMLKTLRPDTGPRPKKKKTNGGGGGENGIGAGEDKGAGGLPIIEEASHAIGGRNAAGEALGTLGRLGCFSFYANKNLAAGSGGLVATNDDELAEQLRRLRHHCLVSPANGGGPVAPYDATDVGYDYRPTEITAALARVQLTKLPRIIEQRARLFQHYHELLGEVDEVALPFRNPENWGSPAYNLMLALFPSAEARNAVRETLNEEGIQTGYHYRPIHTLRHYSSIVLKEKVSLPQTEQYAQRVLTLPLHSRMTEDDVEQVVGVIKESLSDGA